jgi:large subunit ribosomal protein L15
MQIHTLKLKKRKAKKTIGRGGKKGTYSGRGNKGQKSRSGASINPLFEGGRSSLIDRMKKKRGFKSVREPVLAVSLNKVAGKIAKFEKTDIINAETLLKYNIIKKKDINRKIKLVGSATFDGVVTVDDKILMTKSAEKSLMKARKTEKSGPEDSVSVKAPKMKKVSG